MKLLKINSTILNDVKLPIFSTIGLNISYILYTLSKFTGLLLILLIPLLALGAISETDMLFWTVFIVIVMYSLYFLSAILGGKSFFKDANGLLMVLIFILSLTIGSIFQRHTLGVENIRSLSSLAIIAYVAIYYFFYFFSSKKLLVKYVSLYFNIGLWIALLINIFNSTIDTSFLFNDIHGILFICSSIGLVLTLLQFKRVRVIGIINLLIIFYVFTEAIPLFIGSIPYVELIISLFTGTVIVAAIYISKDISIFHRNLKQISTSFKDLRNDFTNNNTISVKKILPFLRSIVKMFIILLPVLILILLITASNTSGIEIAQVIESRYENVRQSFEILFSSGNVLEILFGISLSTSPTEFLRLTNSYVSNVLLSTGIIGFIGVILLYIYSIYSIDTAALKKRKTWSYYSIICLATSNIFIISLSLFAQLPYYIFLIWWITFGLIMRLVFTEKTPKYKSFKEAEHGNFMVQGTLTRNVTFTLLLIISIGLTYFYFSEIRAELIMQ